MLKVDINKWISIFKFKAGPTPLSKQQQMLVEPPVADIQLPADSCSRSGGGPVQVSLSTNIVLSFQQMAPVGPMYSFLLETRATAVSLPLVGRKSWGTSIGFTQQSPVGPLHSSFTSK